MTIYNIKATLRDDAREPGTMYETSATAEVMLSLGQESDRRARVSFHPGSYWDCTETVEGTIHEVDSGMLMLRRCSSGLPDRYLFVSDIETVEIL